MYGSVAYPAWTVQFEGLGGETLKVPRTTNAEDFFSTVSNFYRATLIRYA